MGKHLDFTTRMELFQALKASLVKDGKHVAYRDDNSDASIAKQFGVKEQTVKRMRTKEFGTLKVVPKHQFTNAERKKAVEARRSSTTKTATSIKELSAKIDKMNEHLNTLAYQTGAMTTRLARLSSQITDYTTGGQLDEKSTRPRIKDIAETSI